MTGPRLHGRSALAMFLVLLALLAATGLYSSASTANLQTSQPYAVYEGCVNTQVNLDGSQVPLEACFLLTVAEDGSSRVSVTSLNTPLASTSQLRSIIQDALLEAFNQASRLEGDATPVGGSFSYVKVSWPAECSQVYTAGSGGVQVSYINTSKGLVPATIQASLSRQGYMAEVQLTLTYLNDPGACGSPVVTQAKLTVLEGGVVAVLAGAAAAVLWRVRAGREMDARWYWSPY